MEVEGAIEGYFVFLAGGSEHGSNLGHPSTERMGRPEPMYPLQAKHRRKHPPFHRMRLYKNGLGEC